MSLGIRIGATISKVLKRGIINRHDVFEPNVSWPSKIVFSDGPLATWGEEEDKILPLYERTQRGKYRYAKRRKY